LAVDRVSGVSRPFRLVAGVQWLAYHLFSLETLLVLFIFGHHLKAILPSPPLFPETVFYGAASIAVGLWVVLHRGIYLRGLPIVFTGLVFSGWMLAAYAWSPSAVLARESLVYVLGINLWALFVTACVVAASRERMLRLLMLIVCVAVVLSAYGAYIEIVHGSFRFYRGDYGDWHFRTYLIWGNIVGPGAAILMAMVIYPRLGSLEQLVALGCFLVCLYFMLVCGPRGPLLGLLLAMIAFLAVNLPRIHGGRIELHHATLLGVVLIGGVIGYVVYLFSTDQVTATLGRFTRLIEQAHDPLLRPGANRFDYFAGAYRAWLQAPILGHGLQGFTVVFCSLEDPGCHPHNAFLQVLAEFGLIGFVLYVIFLWTALRNFSPTRLREDPLLTMLLLLFMMMTVYAMVHVYVPTDHRMFFFIGLLALRPPPVDDDEEEEEEEDAF